MTNVRKLLVSAATAAVLSVAAFGASAEQYQGVLQIQSTASRAAARAEGAVAAHSANPYADGAVSGVPVVVGHLSDRAQARADAFAAARAGNIYGDGAWTGPNERFVSSLDRATVRAQAAAAARGVDALAL